MNKKEVTVIRVVTMEDTALMELHGRLIERYYPDLHTTSCCIPDQFSGIHSPETKALALPKIMELAKAHRNSDAIIISCCDDPAVEELRRELSIPVIGAGASVCALALSMGTRVGMVGITDYPPEPYKRMLGDSLINLGRPDGVTCTLDLMTDAGRQSVVRQALELRARGAEVIALACSGMSTIDIAGTLEAACGLPVVDPVMAEGLFAYYACLKAENKQMENSNAD